ncbi:hypothetical protein [Pseudomonas leptonychotis]|uniref:hypothetical protein n=1 Tax=Pseudomonas leptonychotis TaxID=2448482 RepID=UPI00386B4960
MAKTPAQRQAEKRERDKLADEERLSRLLSRRIEIDIYKAADYSLIRCLVRAGIEEPQDLITRLIHNADLLSDFDFARATALRN